MSDTERLALPLMEAAQAQKHVTHNEALVALDALVHLSVADRDLAAPPGSPADGAAWIVAAGASGAWAGKEGLIAQRTGGAWRFHAPCAGMLCFVADEGVVVLHDGADWLRVHPQDGFADLDHVGIGTTADSVNPLAVKGPNVLFAGVPAGEGGTGEIRLKANKEAAGDTASLLFQTGWSGRAEAGLIGDDHFRVKVSADGATWRQAIDVDPATGEVSFPSAGLANASLAAMPAASLKGRQAGAGAPQDLTRTQARTLLRVNRPNVALRNYLAGSAWISSTSAADNSWRDVCWSPELGLFCAVAISGSGNRVMTSPDGITWTARTSASDNNWRGICWSPALGLFCAVAYSGTGNRVMTSPDGVTWTARASAADNNWRAVCWSPELGLFCAVAENGTGNRVMTSPDGIAWTMRATPENTWRNVCWSPDRGLFCAVATTGTGNRVMTSPDGVTWTSRASAADNDWYGVCWSSELGLFCAVGTSGTGNRVMTSPDGVAWTTRASAADNDWYSVTWAPEIGLFCAVGNTGSGNRVMTSPDGVTWTAGTSAANNDWYSVCWSGELGLFCAIAYSGVSNRVMTSVSAYAFPYRS